MGFTRTLCCTLCYTCCTVNTHCSVSFAPANGVGAAGIRIAGVAAVRRRSPRRRAGNGARRAGIARTTHGYAAAGQPVVQDASRGPVQICPVGTTFHGVAPDSGDESRPALADGGEPAVAHGALGVDAAGIGLARRGAPLRGGQGQEGREEEDELHRAAGDEAAKCIAIRRRQQIFDIPAFFVVLES